MKRTIFLTLESLPGDPGAGTQRADDVLPAAQTKTPHAQAGVRKAFPLCETHKINPLGAIQHQGFSKDHPPPKGVHPSQQLGANQPASSLFGTRRLTNKLGVNQKGPGKHRNEIKVLS